MSMTQIILLLVIFISTIVLIVKYYLYGKCRFSDHRKFFREEDTTCSKERGYYYGIGRGGGCYRSLDEKGKESSYYRR